MTELVFILDRSGSMSGLEGDTIDGYENASKYYDYDKVRKMIERQRGAAGNFSFLAQTKTPQRRPSVSVSAPTARSTTSATRKVLR